MKKALLFAFVLFSAFIAQAQLRYLKGSLSGAQEVPANSSAASGVVIVKYNTATNSLQLFGNYRGLTAAVSGAHIHGPAAIGVNTGVLFHLTTTGGTSGTLSLSRTITEAQESELLTGLWYVNVHNSSFTGGEIRTQLLATTEGQTTFLNARLQGSQEVMPTNSTATGFIHVLIEEDKDSLYLTGNYNGLKADITGAHIHTGNPGANGGIIYHLVNSGGATGTLHLATNITSSHETTILNSGTYVNVHNSVHTGGEIRGQITSYSQRTFLAGSLSGAAEVPANSSAGKGTVIVRYNPETNLLQLQGDYQNLSGTVMSAHVHGPAAAGANADVIFGLTHSGGTTGTLSAEQTLNEMFEMDLYSGLLYVNVHTTAFGGGEVRAQLQPTTVGRSHYLTGTLQGGQEVPPSGSTGSGTVTSLLDAITGNVFVTGTFAGLGSNAAAAHIHQQRPGSNGSVLIHLSVPASTEGTVTGTGVLSAAQVTEMINGGMYVNLHSTVLNSGELRAQLGNLVLPLKLLSFNGLKEREKITLTWTSAQETNLLSYDIEQQHSETKAWIKKGTVPARGGSSNTDYRYSDVPLAGNSPVVLYRLRINEANGSTNYSQVVRVNYQTGKAELALLSNPVTNGLLRFTVTGLPAGQKGEASVIDYSGRVLVKGVVTLQGNNEVNISHLSSGMYRLVVHLNGETMQQSFVK